MAKKVDTNHKRVVGFIGHAGAGKTSICEAILYLCKANERLGAVDAGQSVMDFEPEEQKRQYSVSTAFFDVMRKDHQIFMLDTPGNSNFIPEGYAMLPVMGAAVLPVDALEGVKFQSEIMAQRAQAEKLPFVAVINRLDKEHSDFDKAVQSIKESLPVEPVLIHLPIGKEDGFSGVVDLLANKAYTYDGNGGIGKAIDIPADMADQVEEMRSTMIERLVEGDDEIMMKYLEGEEVTDEELQQCLKNGLLNLQFCPVLCASALKNIGVDLLLDLICQTFPNPTEERPRTVVNLSSGEEESLTISEDGEFAAQVIKTLSDPFAGKVSIFRVYRGSLAPDEQFYNLNQSSKDKPGKLFYVRGKKQEGIEGASTGEICAVLKVKDIATGDSLCIKEANGVKFPELPKVAPMVNLAIRPKTQGEEEKMAAALTRILEEDPNLSFWREEQTKDFILSGMGQSQIDVAMERMNRKFSVEVELSEPKIPYRETIRGKAEAQGKYKKQTGGRGQYGDCHIRVEPFPGGGFEFVDAIVGGVIPRQFIPAVEKGIVEAMVKGELTGNPVQDVKVELFFGSYHNVDSSEMAFKVAGSMAWKKCMLEAKPVILEPIMKVAITVPSEYMGDVYGNISSRRGKVQGSEDEAKLTVIHAEIPQSEMHTLSPDLRAMTQDKAFFTANFDHYEEVPAAIAEKIAAEYRKSKEEE